MLIPFFALFRFSLAGNAQGTAQYTVPVGEQLTLKDMVFSSTGAFSITNIRDASGKSYTNASPTTPIPSTIFPSGGNNNNSIKGFDPELVIEGGNILYIDVVDSSGSANTINIVFSGQKKTGN